MKELKNKEQRVPIQHFKKADFLVKARLKMQLSRMDKSNGGSLPILNEIVHIANRSTPTYMLLVTCNHQQYLMNFDGEICSDGYDKIIQLFNKTPHAEAFIVERNHRLGILNKKGESIIPCTFKRIELVRRLQHKGFVEYSCIDSDVVGYYICEDDKGQHSLYNHDGELIFHNAEYILPGEESIKHSYDPYTNDRYQIRQLETLHVYMSVQYNNKTFLRKYIYKLIEDEKQDYTTFTFLSSERDERDKEAIENPPVPCTNPHNEDSYPGLLLNWGYGQGLCIYLRHLLNDASVYEFIVPEHIHWDHITYFKRLAHSMTDKIFSKKDAQGSILYPKRCFTDVIEYLEKLERIRPKV